MAGVLFVHIETAANLSRQASRIKARVECCAAGSTFRSRPIVFPKTPSASQFQEKWNFGFSVFFTPDQLKSLKISVMECGIIWDAEISSLSVDIDDRNFNSTYSRNLEWHKLNPNGKILMICRLCLFTKYEYCKKFLTTELTSFGFEHNKMRIVLERPFYFPGETIRGLIVYTANSPKMEFEGLNLKFSAQKFECIGEDQLTHSFVDARTNIHMTSFKKLCQQYQSKYSKNQKLQDWLSSFSSSQKPANRTFPSSSSSSSSYDSASFAEPMHNYNSNDSFDLDSIENPFDKKKHYQAPGIFVVPFEFKLMRGLPPTKLSKVSYSFCINRSSSLLQFSTCPVQILPSPDDEIVSNQILKTWQEDSGFLQKIDHGTIPISIIDYGSAGTNPIKLTLDVLVEIRVHIKNTSKAPLTQLKWKVVRKFKCTHASKNHKNQKSRSSPSSKSNIAETADLKTLVVDDPIFASVQPWDAGTWVGLSGGVKLYFSSESLYIAPGDEWEGKISIKIPKDTAITEDPTTSPHIKAHEHLSIKCSSNEGMEIGRITEFAVIQPYLTEGWRYPNLNPVDLKPNIFRLSCSMTDEKLPMLLSYLCTSDENIGMPNLYNNFMRKSSFKLCGSPLPNSLFDESLMIIPPHSYPIPTPMLTSYRFRGMDQFYAALVAGQAPELYWQSSHRKSEPQ